MLKAKRGTHFYGEMRYMFIGTITKHRLIGRQVEYLVVCYDQDNHKVRLSLRQADILAALASDEKLLQQGGGVPDVQTGDAE
jgi:predicted RNA-binding protein with RPS1 domain